MLDWIKDPVSAKDYARQRKAKGCGKPTDMWFPSGKFCKSISCINGEFEQGDRVIQDVLACVWTKHNLEQANRLAPQGYLHHG